MGAALLRAMPADPIDILAIGASTGGIHALGVLFQALPKRIGVPILVTQHLPAAFMPVFARQLGTIAGREAVVAEDGMRLRPDVIFLAPGDAHLTVEPVDKSVIVRLTHDRSVSGCMPSVDPMFASVGAVFNSGALGVVLTGMGRDGVEGASRWSRAAGSVIAQDEASCAVWGMPRAVLEAGLPCAVLPPDKIARRIAGRTEEAADLQISDSSAASSRGLLEASTGQQLTMSRRWRIETALASLLRERGIATLDELITILVMGKEPSLSQQVVEALLNNETYFFRDRSPFDLLAALCAARACVRRRAKSKTHPHLVGGLLDRAGSLFARDAVRRRAGKVGRLDDRHPRHRRLDRLRRSRSRRHLQPVRGPARPRHQPDDQVVRGMSGRLARGGAPSQAGAFPGPQPARAAAAPRRLRHRPVPQRPALSQAREEEPGVRALAAAMAPDGWLMLGAGETVIGQTSKLGSGCQGAGSLSAGRRGQQPGRNARAPTAGPHPGLDRTGGSYAPTARMLDVIDLPSPNFDERVLPVSMIVLHYTGMPDCQGRSTG